MKRCDAEKEGRMQAMDANGHASSLAEDEDFAVWKSRNKTSARGTRYSGRVWLLVLTRASLADKYTDWRLPIISTVPSVLRSNSVDFRSIRVERRTSWMSHSCSPWIRTLEYACYSVPAWNQYDDRQHCGSSFRQTAADSIRPWSRIDVPSPVPFHFVTMERKSHRRSMWATCFYRRQDIHAAIDLSSRQMKTTDWTEASLLTDGQPLRVGLLYIDKQITSIEISQECVEPA